ncbi:MAG: type II toxin-antitoxin system HicB family antitoxin [Nitrospira sp.]|nr:type II toxin-antitoxin system HicB family antitoxin [Nitrospira sp.]
MRSTKYIIWEEDGQWHGYLQDYPDLPTQGDSFEDLQMKLSDLHCEISSGDHDRYHNPISTIPQRTRLRTKRHERVEQLFRTMLYDL